MPESEDKAAAVATERPVIELAKKQASPPPALSVSAAAKGLFPTPCPQAWGSAGASNIMPKLCAVHPLAYVG